MTKELLQQCLKALLPHGSCYGNGKRPVEDAAIEGLEQAITQEQPAQGPVAWEGAEGWEPLAWHLCAEENGEEACSELIWEGGAIPEPWGDRWLKYEHEAKRMIATVKKFAPPTQPAQEPVAAHPIGFDYLDSGQLVATYALPVEGKNHPKLYTHPAPTQPALSDDEILNCFYASKSEGMASYMLAVGRAIEARCRGGLA